MRATRPSARRPIHGFSEKCLHSTASVSSRWRGPVETRGLILKRRKRPAAELSAAARGTAAVPRGKIKVVMVYEIEAVYENGVLRPLSPVRLAESETVHVSISTCDTGLSQLDASLVERARTELARRPAVASLEEVQQAAAVIPGNWSDNIIAERGEY